jgi:hypothetical protein
VYEIDETIKSKCKFLYSCLVNNGSRKCIIYCIDTNEIKEMMRAIEILDDYYYLDFHMDSITSSINHKKRDEILITFANSTVIELLFSVRILDECIDIPQCDSIFITYPSQSKIRTIQRMSRCIRIDKYNKFKIGNIYIWCDEYSKILVSSLNSIKSSTIRERNDINKYLQNITGTLVYADPNIMEKMRNNLFICLDVYNYSKFVKDEKNLIPLSKQEILDIELIYKKLLDDETNYKDIYKLTELLKIQYIISDSDYYQKIIEIEKNITNIQLTKEEELLIEKIIKHPKLEGLIEYSHFELVSENY